MSPLRCARSSPFARVDILSRFEDVIETGPGRYMMKCGAHPDAHRSLSYRVLDDGRKLFHCFALCPTRSVLAAAGLTFADLFPERAVDHHVRREREPFPARDVLKALLDESLIVAVVGSRLGAGYLVDADEIRRMNVAVGRIARAIDLSASDVGVKHRAARFAAEEELAHA